MDSSTSIQKISAAPCYRSGHTLLPQRSHPVAVDARASLRQHVEAEPAEALADKGVEERIDERLGPEEPRDALQQARADAVATDRHDDHDAGQRQLEDDEEENQQRDGHHCATIETPAILRHQHR